MGDHVSREWLMQRMFFDVDRVLVLEETQKIMCEEFDADELFERVKRETGITMVDVSDGGVFDD